MNCNHRLRRWVATALGCVAAAAAQAADPVPARIVGEPIRREFDGRGDDLLSAGLGAEGLRGPVPGFALPAAPTALELRRRAIWANYRALTDQSDAGGFGRLSGPRPGERIAGIEYLAAVQKPGGDGITTVMLQIPAAFDPARPCLVAVASSGSRGVYGALPTAGEWGLRKGCAVVHSDKGTGTGFHDLDSGTVYRIDLLATTDAGDPMVTWRAPESAALAAWRRAHPHRVAVRHAHDGENSERDWGIYLLQAAQAAFTLLEREFPPTADRRAITPGRTLVIASGISNGGNAVLRAVEADAGRLFDGAVVSEPNVWTEPDPKLEIRMGERPPVRAIPASLFDHALLHYLLQPVAVLAPDEASAMTAVPPPLRPQLEQWAAGLSDIVFGPQETIEQRARGARQRLEEAGVLREALDGGIAHIAFGLWPALAENYASAYGGFGPEASPCGLSYAPIDAAFRARAATAEELARLAADSNGIAPTGGLQIVDEAGAFASFGSLKHLLCMRGVASSARLRQGAESVQATGRVRDTPVVIIHGRRDALVPVNFTSRAWYALHRRRGGQSAHYYEVEHGHHFDAFNALPGWGERFVPMQPQLLAAMDLMHAHLATGARLPPSQVVRSHPRRLVDGQPEPLMPAHLGRIVDRPGNDTIRFRRGILRVPD